MNAPPGRSFAIKLTLLITVVSGVAAVLVCAALMLLQARRELSGAVAAADAHARIIAANSTAALDFDDEAAARGTLAGLDAVPEIAAAQISTPAGEPFARYHDPRVASIPPLDAGPPRRIGWQWLTLSEPIVRDEEQIGAVTILYDLAPARQRLLNDLAIAVLVVGVATVLAFFAARRLQHALLRPVRELAGAAAAIASTNNYDIRARKYSSDELGVLTDVFNAMVERIKEAEDIRKDHQATLEREVARRTAEVLETQSRLRQSERMASLGTLSAGLGHDIGNILMPLRSHVSAIRDRLPPDGAGAAPAEGDFTAIAKATEYLQNLSTGLRLLAQDPERIALPREATRLAPWWTATDPLLRAMIGSRIALRADLPPELPCVKVARSLLTQAVFNLVQNAAQAMTPEEGPPPQDAQIRVWAAAVKGENGDAWVRLAVTDNGPGMTDEVRRRCLEPYFTTKTRRISSGLGLTLVKGIVEGVRGSLEVESTPGGGSTFSLLLPAESASQARKSSVVVMIAESRRRAVVSHLLKALDCDVRIGPPETAPAAPAAPGEIWVTDSLRSVPHAFSGRIILLGDPPEPPNPPAPPGSEAGRTIVVDPATPLPILRKLLLEILPSEHDDEHAHR